ncbi:NB-ARC domain-containing protein [Streptomyces sp. NBUL23]|uniref:NB-ARC domain-containing protein n=1 Tax=Streptomyces sp. NBUL23 TaxID=3381354 RepID=UPI003871EBCC
MLDAASRAAATAAGAAVAEAATTEQWSFVRDEAARLLGEGDARAELDLLQRLDVNATAVRQTSATDREPRVRMEAHLQTRFELLLEKSEGVERLRCTDQLLRLVQLSRTTYATAVTVAQVTGALSIGSGAGTGETATVVGRIPSEAAAFRRRAETGLLDGPSSIHVLTGPAGTGKTQLAAHIARCALRDATADMVVWVNATSADMIVCGYADAAAVTTEHDRTQPERSAEAFRSWLSWTDLRWLVVLDGVSDTADLHGLWPTARPNGQVLVTARRATSLPGGSGHVELGAYRPDEAADQLTRELVSLGGAKDDPREIAALVAALRHHPLALSTAAAFMTHEGLSCAAYRDRLTRFASSGAARDAVNVGWWVSLEAADRHSTGLARPILELASFLDPHGVPVSVLTSPPALRYLALRAVQRRGPVAPQSAEAGDVRNALDVLHRLHLVEVDSDLVHPSLRLSTLVQAAVLTAVPAVSRDALALSAADALRAVWRTASDRPHSPLCRALRSSADLLTGHAGETLWRSHCHPLLFQVGRNLIDAGLIRAARIRWDWLHARLDQRFGPDHADTLAARGYQARLRGASQDAAGAVASYRDLLRDLERVLGPDNPDVLTVRDNLARWQGIAGDPVRAAAAYTLLLDDRLRVLGPAHPDTLLTRHNIALWRGQAGDAAGAAEAYAKLLDDMVRTFDANAPAVLEIRDQLTEWRTRAADAVAATRVPATAGPRPDQLEPASWSPPAPDGGVRQPNGTSLSAEHLLSEPPLLSRLRRLLLRRGGKAAEQTPAAGPASPVSGCHRVSVISLKGGTGKTTTAVALGATLAGQRDDPVIALDASPAGGTLGRRVRRENDFTVLDLLAALPTLDGHDAIRDFTTTGPNGLEILAHDVTPTLSTPFSAQQYHRVVDALTRAYPLVVTDSGTGLMQEAMHGVLSLTDQLVVVATASVDGAGIADVTLDWLSRHGHAELARRALVVLSAVHPGPARVRTDRIVKHFADRCQGVVTVPFDEHLATGAELDLSQLRADTRRAYARLAALVSEGLPRASAERGGDRARGRSSEQAGHRDRPVAPTILGSPLPEPAAPPAAAIPPAEPAASAISAAPGPPHAPCALPPAAPPPPPPEPTAPSAPSAPTPARPRRQPQVTVAEDVVHIGTPTTVAFSLAVIDPQDAELDRTEPMSVLVIATPRSSATLNPPVASCATDDETPARFTFTAWEPGEHRLRFRVCDPTTGKVLQVVEVTLPVAAPVPLGRP